MQNQNNTDILIRVVTSSKFHSMTSQGPLVINKLAIILNERVKDVHTNDKCVEVLLKSTATNPT